MELPRIIKKVAETLIKKKIPANKIYLYRNFLKFEEYNDEYKLDMEETLKNYKEYKEKEITIASKYNIIERTEEEE